MTEQMRESKQIVRIRLQRYLPDRRKYEEILGFTVLVSAKFWERLPDFEDMVKKWVKGIEGAE